MTDPAARRPLSVPPSQAPNRRSAPRRTLAAGLAGAVLLIAAVRTLTAAEGRLPAAVDQSGPSEAYRLAATWPGGNLQGPADTMLAPAGIDATADALYVADSGNDRIDVLGFDGKLLANIGGPGTGAGQLSDPRDVAVVSGMVHVADRGNARIVHFASDGKAQGEWPLPEGLLPWGLAAGGGKVYISVPERGLILVLANGREEARWAVEGEPRGLDLGPDGSLYVAEPRGRAVLQLDAAGKVIKRFPQAKPEYAPLDLSVDDNGDLYILANATRGSSAYRLYRVAGTDLQTVANNGAVTATGIGTNLGLTGTPNGLTEVTNAVTGCAANINTYPCLIASTGTTNRTWGINTQNGSAASIGVTGFTLNDLSRSFPVDAQVAKARTSPAVMTQGDNLTISYTITVTNAGPGLIGGGATVTDTLNPAIFNAAAATWTCAVTNAGDANSSIDTACNAASGTGNINQTVTLAPAGVITYTLQAPVLNTFNGTATNAATMALVQNVTDPVPGNDTGDAPGTTVNAATVLTISKANTGTAIVAGTTTSYVITVANTGFADADDTAVRDADTDGLACTQVACTSAVGPGAACPPPANVTIANLQNPGPSGGIRLPDFPYGTTVTFTVTCLVENP